MLVPVDFGWVFKKNKPTRRRAIDQMIDDIESGIHIQPEKMSRGDGGIGLFTPIAVEFRQTDVRSSRSG